MALLFEHPYPQKWLGSVFLFSGKLVDAMHRTSHVSSIVYYGLLVVSFFRPYKSL